MYKNLYFYVWFLFSILSKWWSNLYFYVCLNLYSQVCKHENVGVISALYMLLIKWLIILPIPHQKLSFPLRTYFFVLFIQYRVWGSHWIYFSHDMTKKIITCKDCDPVGSPPFSTFYHLPYKCLLSLVGCFSYYKSGILV